MYSKIDWHDFFTMTKSDITRGAKHKLFVRYSRTSMRKYTFSNRACKSRDLVFILKTSGALRLSLGYFNVEIPIQKVKFVFEDVVDEQFAELSKNFA